MGLLKRPKRLAVNSYQSFDQIDGRHPLQQAVEDFCVQYNVRVRPGGEVAWFNFELAWEMGLLAKDHPRKLNKKLEQKLLETFGIAIINEYDLANKSVIKKDSIKPHPHMATRYLQLQHPTKQGKTSGDGRSIWNGYFRAKGVTWDISSCGTGATRLSPATAWTKKFFKSGDPTASYGCGHADLLDGISAGLMSEIFHGKGIRSERILCVIEYPGQRAINVRVGKNLLRPGHLFRYLKQDHHHGLTQIVDHYIDRQITNGEWPQMEGKHKRYDYLLKKVVKDFANTSAVFEAEYIFCWLEWDGDNILMDGGIVDYGSVRQFGLYHHEYRYDDGDRMSTNLTEQKYKSKYIVKTFAQLVGYLKTGKKKNLREFDCHPCLEEFDRMFQRVKCDIILKKMGFDQPSREYLCRRHRKLVEKFLSCHFYFESYKSKEGLVEASDGITHNAVFCMRDLLREYPKILLSKQDELLKFDQFAALFASSYACDDELASSPYKIKQAREWQLFYRQLVERVVNKFAITSKELGGKMVKLAAKHNRYAQITGDSIVYVAKEFIRYKNQAGFESFAALSREFIKEQIDHSQPQAPVVKQGARHQEFWQKISRIVVDFREGL